MSMPHENSPVLAAGAKLGEARAAMILIHGRGASAQDILTLVPYLDFPDMAYLAPQAEGFTWYPNRFIVPVEHNEPHLSAALSKVDGLVRHVEAGGIPIEKVFIGGFSQGACLASEYVIRNPRPYGGLLAFSGGYIGPIGPLREAAGRHEERNGYASKMDSVSKLLKGRTTDLMKMLSVRMEEEAAEENFERATVIRDSIKILRSQFRRGKNIGIKEKNRDVASIAREGRTGVFVILKLRNGMVSDILLRRFNASEKISDYMAMKELLLDHYSHTTDFDIEQIVTPFEFESDEFKILFKEKKVVFAEAASGEINRQLYETAQENGLTHLHSFISKEYIPKGVLKMRAELGVSVMPRMVAGVDISHFSGKWSSGAVVVFRDFKPFKSAYRYYKIEEIGNDDYKSMEHVLSRFLEKYKIDILLVDGGLGQMNVAKQVKEKLNLEFPIFALAKKFNTLYNEEGKIITFLPYSKTNMLLKAVRDESHRFANKLRKIRMEKIE